jgi:hypothetical protein
VLATTVGEKVKIWNLDTRTPEAIFPVTLPKQIAFTADGHYLVITARGGKALVWSVESRKIVQYFEDPQLN